MTTETLGFLLQGVSQQQPKVRSPGQVSEQVNWLSDVNRGLTTRPGTERLGVINAITEDTSKSFTVSIGNDLYRVVLENNRKPKVFDYTGAAKTVSGANTQAYISTDAAVYTYDQKVYITNRNKVVATKATSYTSTVKQNWGYVYCLGGLFTRTYKVTLTVDGTAVEGEYTTPDGDVAGDAEKASADYIIEQLRDALIAALATASITTVSFQMKENHLRIVSSANDLDSISCRDGEAGSMLKGDVARCETIADLPKFAASHDYLKIYGVTDSKDDFWMRFEVDGVTTTGGHYGEPGAWKEYFDVTEPATLDETTMPHVLSRNVDGTFTFAPEDWKYRRVGNEETNPTPSFVGFAIRDIREFQGRLVFATSGANVVMSRTDLPTDFWRKTATAAVASDVIDIRATMEGTKAFDWLIPFDRDMFVLASNAQYVISGSGAVTPDNIGLVLATNYNMSSKARPQPTGRTLLFPYLGQRFSGVNEYFTGNDYATTSVDNLTKTASKYIDGEITEIVVAPNEGIALFLTTASASTGEVWVYKYLWEFDKKTQSAWSKWKFPGKVRHMYTEKGIVYFWIVIGDEHVFMGKEDVTWDGEDNAAYQYVDLEEIVVSCRLDTPDMYEFDYPLSIDGAVHDVGTVTGDWLEISTTYSTPAFILYSEDDNAPSGGVIVPDELDISGEPGDETITYRFNIVDRPWLLDGVITYGLRMDRYLDPSPPVAMKNNGFGQVSARSDVQIIVHAYYVDYADSGQFSVSMLSDYRGDAVMANTDWFPMDDDPVHPWEESVRSGTLQVPWGEFSQYASLRVFSNDIRPTTIQEIRYDPEYMQSGG